MITIESNKRLLFGLFVILFIVTAAVCVVTRQYVFAVLPFVLLFFYTGWQQMRLIFLLLIASLPFSAETQLTTGLATDFPDELLMLFVSFLFLAYWIYKPFVLTGKILWHPLIVLLIAGFCWAILTSLNSTYPFLSFKYLLAKTWYFGAFIMAPLILFREKSIIKNTSAILVISMIVVTMVTLIRHSFYGFSFATINDALYPFFRNHVNYSSMLVCTIPAVYIYWRSAATKQMKRLAGIVLTILLVALLFSYARGAWLALLMGILASWLIRKKLLVAFYIGLIAVLLVGFCWIKSNDRYLNFANDYRTTIWHEDFSDHLIATYRLKDVSTAERFYRWIAGVRMIKDKWFSGYGPNSFYYNYKPYAVPAFKTWVSDNKEHSTVHNYFLLLAIEQGIPGLILFLLLAGSMLYYSQHLYHRVSDLFYKNLAWVIAVVLMMILTVNFLSDLIETDKIGSLFFLCLSLLVATDVQMHKKHSKAY